MKLQKLIITTPWEDIKSSILKYYPDQEKSIGGYETIYWKLTSLEPSEEKADMVIHVTKISYEENTKTEIDPWYDVHGINGTMNEYDPEIEQTYALEFSKWEEWAGMTIDYMTMEQFSNEDIVAFCMYEMTFFGFEQEAIQEQLDDLNERIDSIKDGTAVTYSWDEVKQRLKDKFDWLLEDDEEDEDKKPDDKDDKKDDDKKD